MHGLKPISNAKLTYNESEPLNGAFTYLKNRYNVEKINDLVVRIKTKTSVEKRDESNGVLVLIE